MSHRLSPVLLPLAATLVACHAGGPVHDPAALGSLATVETIAFAAELSTNACKLESLPGTAAPDASAAWTRFDPSERAGETFSVTDRRGTGEVGNVSRALQLRDAQGVTRWVRNPPSTSAADAERAWSCAGDAAVLTRAARPIAGMSVRLVPTAKTCAGLTPELGDAADVTFEPYTILGRRLERTERGIVPITILASIDATSVLVVTQADLDSCFAVTQRAGTAPEERARMSAWLTAGTGTAAPDAGLAAYLHVAGLEDRDCLAEGAGPTRHDECRAAAFGAAKSKTDGANTIRLVRQRVADAVHAYGGKIATASDVAGMNVLVKEPSSKDAALPGAFSKMVQVSMSDPSEVRARAEHGFRLIRSSDVAEGATANAVVELEVSYPMPKLETIPQDRTQRQVRGKVAVPNPAHEEAGRRTESARVAVVAADRDAALVRSLFKTRRPTCDAASAALACDGVVLANLGEARSTARRAALTKAESALVVIPPTVDRDDVVSVDYRAKVLRRKGDAFVAIKVTTTDASPGIPGFRVARKVPFEVTDIDVASDPSRGIAAHAGKAPTDAQVSAAVARTAFLELSAVLETWMMRSTLSMDPNAFERGSRAHLALLARHAASNRHVHLVSDLIENRAASLAQGKLEYPVTVTSAVGGCQTFVATALERGHDVDLTLRTSGTREIVGRDTRPAADAGLDLCPLAPGSYLIEVSFKDARAVPAAIGLFESTPGLPMDPDYGTAMPARMDRAQP